MKDKNRDLLAEEGMVESKEYDIADMDSIIKQLLKKYERLEDQNDVKSSLVLKNIRLRHPLF